MKIFFNEAQISVSSLFYRARKISFKAASKFTNDYKINHGLRFTVSSFKSKKKYTDYILIDSKEKFDIDDDQFNFINSSNLNLYFDGNNITDELLIINGQDIINISEKYNNNINITEFLSEKYEKNTFVYDDFYNTYDEFHKHIPDLEDEDKITKIDFSEKQPQRSDLKSIVSLLTKDEHLRYIRDDLGYEDAAYFILDASRELIENGAYSRYFTEKRINWLLKLYNIIIQKFDYEGIN